MGHTDCQNPLASWTQSCLGANCVSAVPWRDSFVDRGFCPLARRRCSSRVKPQSVTSKAIAVGKDILCSETTGDIADAVAGVITGGAASSGISALNARYAASVGGEIGSIVGRRAVLIAAGPQALIAVGVALGTSYAVRYARGKVCPASAGK
jgi:hypothetical protein